MIKKIIATVVMLALVATAGVFAYQTTHKNSHSQDGELKVAASYYPLYDFARQVGGDRVSVINMTPAGAEPHDYEPSPQELIVAHESSVFIYNGGLMEPWVDSFLSDYKQVAVKASDGITLLEEENHDDHAHDDHGHSHGQADPHFWLDPVIAQRIVDTIRDGLAAADPGSKDYYYANAKAYNQRLSELDQSFTEGLSNCTLDTAISSHGAFSYLAHRYDFTVEPIAGLEPDSEPSPARMAELTALAKRAGLRYVFFESLVSPRLAETIAREAGTMTLVFDPIEGLSAENQNKGKDYLSIQYDNLANLKKALECQ